MKHHNFVIGKNEKAEQKIEQEIEVLRKSNSGFKVLNMKVIPSSIGSTLATIEYVHD